MRNKILSKLLVGIMLASTLFTAPCSQVFANEGLSTVGDTSSVNTTVNLTKESPVNIVVTIPANISLTKCSLAADEDAWAEHLNAGIDIAATGADRFLKYPTPLCDYGLVAEDALLTDTLYEVSLGGMSIYEYKVRNYYDCVDTIAIEGVPASIGDKTPMCEVSLASNSFTLSSTSSSSTLTGKCDFISLKYADWNNCSRSKNTGGSLARSTSLASQKYPVIFAFQGTPKANETYEGTVTFNVELKEVTP